MTCNPLFLTRVAHANEHQIRARPRYEFGQSLLVSPVEKPVVESDHLVTRPFTIQTPGRLRDHVRMGAQQKDPQVRGRPVEKSRDEIRSIEVLAEFGPIKQPTRQIDADPVVENEEAPQPPLHRRIAGALIGQMGVEKGDAEPRPRSHAAIDMGNNVISRSGMDPNPQDVDAGKHRILLRRQCCNPPRGLPDAPR
nr:hypothetical protein [Camelimonas fluminis]